MLDLAMQTVCDFQIDDCRVIQSAGLDYWMNLSPATMADEPFDARLLSIPQQMQVYNLVELGIELEYCVPFYHLDRVLLFTLMPKMPRVIRQQSEPPIAFDSIVPFLLGTGDNKLYRQHVRKFLETASPEWLSDKVISDFLRSVVGKISQAEAQYFAITTRCLRSGMWRHVPAFAGIVAAEEAIIRQEYVNPSVMVNRLLNGGN